MSTQYLKCSNCGREIGSAEPMKVLRWKDWCPDCGAALSIDSAVCKECAEIAGLECDK